jgi:prepilin-type N-terminal cleavage/methylation domain-containing protein
MARRRLAHQRGFTLTELMAVVAIMGILAALGLNALNGHMRASKTGEALSVVQAIRASQERYRAEHQQYFGNSTAWCPSEGVNDIERFAFFSPSCDEELWQTLRPDVERKVQFGYRVASGGPGDALPADGAIVTARKFPSSTTPSEPWYVVQAKADEDLDGTFCGVVATSFSPEVIVENERD